MESNNQNDLPDIIKERKILPETIKKNIINSIFFSIILFIIMLVITLIINVSFNELDLKEFDSYIDIIQIFCALISVGILETAYRKDSGKIALFGIEFLIFSICVLFVPYMYISKDNIAFLKTTITVFAVYYFIKSIIIFLYTKNKYLRENMSDIKELVKEEKKSYLDEQSTKTLKVQKIEAEKRRKDKEEKNKKKLEKAKENNKNSNKQKTKDNKNKSDKKVMKK